MLVATTWRSRASSPDPFNRPVKVRGRLEEKAAKETGSERLRWSLALMEFIELDSGIALDIDSAMPSVLRALEHPTS